MSSRIIPLTALSVMLLVIFWAVVATAQQPGLGQQPIQQQPVDQNQYAQQQQLPQQQPVGQLTPLQPQPGQMHAPQPLPTAPFTLTPEEEAVLDRLLTDWQVKSGGVKVFESGFTRWDYDPIFGDPNAPKSSTGMLRYAAPDKGYFELADGSEKWICTGDAVFKFEKKLKQMREYPLPKEMRGVAIADGPMPFVFGVQAAKMKARYWMRITTPPANQANQVWLEVYPRHAKDAENYKKIDVILSFEHDGTNVTKLEPFALNIHLQNGDEKSAGGRQVYQFSDMKINGLISTIVNFGNWFIRPSTPIGWQHIIEDTGADAPAQGAPGQAGQPQGANPNAATNVQPGIDVGSALPTGAVR